MHGHEKIHGRKAINGGILRFHLLSALFADTISPEALVHLLALNPLHRLALRCSGVFDCHTLTVVPIVELAHTLGCRLVQGVHVNQASPDGISGLAYKLRGDVSSQCVQAFLKIQILHTPKIYQLWLYHFTMLCFQPCLSTWPVRCIDSLVNGALTHET